MLARKLSKSLATFILIMAICVFTAYSQAGCPAGDSNKPQCKATKEKKFGQTEMHKGGDMMMHRGGGMWMQGLAEKLNLTEEQKNAIKPIIQKEVNEMKAIHEKTAAEIKTILTPEQQKKLDELKSGARDRMRTHAKEGMRGRLFEKLNLTEEQKTAIKPIMENQHKEMKAIWDNNSLSHEQKMEQMKALHQKSAEEMKKVLTPEQQKKLDELKATAHERGWGKHEK